MIRNNLASKGLAKDLPQIELFSSGLLKLYLYIFILYSTEYLKKSF